MQRNSLRRRTISPLTQKIKAPQHLLRLQDREDESDGERSGSFRLPSLPSLSQSKAWKNDNNVVSNSSAATSVSWSQEMEDAASQKVEEQWMTVEKFLYGEEEKDNQSLRGATLDECTQWKTQIPYLRIIGRNPATACDDKTEDKIGSGGERKLFDNLQSDKQFAVEHGSLAKEREDSVQYKVNIAKFEDVLDILTEYIVSELFPNEEENDTDPLSESLSDTLKIAPAPVHGNRNSSRNSKRNWTEEVISPNYIENKSLSIRNRLLDTKSSLQTIKNDATYQEIQKRQKSSASKPRDNSGIGENAREFTERMSTPHIGRNRLGTVFSERVVVSPVPFAVSTRESFSTLKTIPIRFMNEDLDIFQGHVSGFQSSARRPAAPRNVDIHSAWQAPVCPTVWPKNVRLAPIDTSTLRSSKNRFAPSPVVLHCGRRPLSPISRPVIPKSAHTTRDRGGDFLEIQGKRIVADQSRLNALTANWDYSPRTVKSKKKRERIKGGKRA